MKIPVALVFVSLAIFRQICHPTGGVIKLAICTLLRHGQLRQVLGRLQPELLAGTFLFVARTILWLELLDVINLNKIETGICFRQFQHLAND